MPGMRMCWPRLFGLIVITNRLIAGDTDLAEG